MKDSKHNMEAKKEKYDSIVYKCGKIKNHSGGAKTRMKSYGGGGRKYKHI